MKDYKVVSICRGEDHIFNGKIVPIYYCTVLVLPEKDEKPSKDKTYSTNTITLTL